MSGDLNFLGRTLEVPAQIELTPWLRRLGPKAKRSRVEKVSIVTTSARVALLLEDGEGRKLELSFGSPGRAEPLLVALLGACREGSLASFKDLAQVLNKEPPCTL